MPSIKETSSDRDIDTSNFSDDQKLSDGKKNLVKRLKLSWYNRNNTDSEILNYQGKNHCIQHFLHYDFECNYGL